jgi:hypothetical protein
MAGYVMVVCHLQRLARMGEEDRFRTKAQKDCSVPWTRYEPNIVEYKSNIFPISYLLGTKKKKETGQLTPWTDPLNSLSQ